MTICFLSEYGDHNLDQAQTLLVQAGLQRDQ